MAAIGPAGTVRTPDEVRFERLRKGYCDRCSIEPVKCFDIKKRFGGVIRERVPLTVPGQVFNGVCLNCHPDCDPDGGRHRHHRRSAPRADGRKGHRSRHAEDRHRHTEDRHRPNTNWEGLSRENSRGHHRPHHDRPLDSQPRLSSPGSPGRGAPVGGVIGIGDNLRRGVERSRSAPSVQSERRPTRQQAYRDLHASLPNNHAIRDARQVMSLPARVQQEGSMSHLDLDELDSSKESEGDGDVDGDGDRDIGGDAQAEGYTEEIEYNIFGDPVVVKKPKRRSGRRSTLGGRPPTLEEEPLTSLPNEPADRDVDLTRSPGHQDSGSRQPRTPGQFNTTSPDFPGLAEGGEEDGAPETPDTARPPLEAEASRPSVVSSACDEGSGDVLTRLARQAAMRNPQKKNFTPSQTGTVLPNSFLEVPEMDDVSVMTKETCWVGRNSVVTFATSGARSMRTNLTAINESSGGDSESSGRRTMASHQIREPAVPAGAAAATGVPPSSVQDSDVSAPSLSNGGRGPYRTGAAAADMESYIESSAPELTALREFVGSCTQAGADAEAINIVTQALIVDNATQMSVDLALFCLTTLWVLARKSDGNKRKIIFEDATFDAIIEAMQIYRETSAEIQTRACGVLWSLSMAADDRKYVTRKGGCDAVLDTMKAHLGDDALQVMALGALKVLSFDNLGKSTLRSRGAPSVVAGVMRRHATNPTMQSEGCVILGNLAVDDMNNFVVAVTEAEVDAVVSGVLAHPDSLEVHEAACFTLMCLASSTENVNLIKRNAASTVALELAFQKHPDDVGINIMTLFKRLDLGGSVGDGTAAGGGAVAPSFGSR